MKSSRGRAYYAHILRKDPCVFCGKLGNRSTIDHIHPKGAGGSNHWLNIAAACHKCNHKKGNQGLLGFLLMRSMTKIDRKAIGYPLTASYATQDDWELPERWYAPVTDLLELGLVPDENLGQYYEAYSTLPNVL